MPKKYHIHTETAAPRFAPVGKYTTVEFRENCAGSCRACVKKRCVYDIFSENMLHASTMSEPEYLYTCMSCFRCVQECTRGIFSRAVNPEYRTLGDAYWRSDTIHRLWYQAHTGKIPVSGAGYRGPFVGAGFDAMWTDMSEIVRPTRDGIHGREYINTSVELTRRHTPLVFDDAGNLAVDAPAILEIPLPLVLQPATDLVVNTDVLSSMARAARMLGTLMLVSPGQWEPALAPFAPSLVPCLDSRCLEALDDRFAGCPAVALTGLENHPEVLTDLRQRSPRLNLFAILPMDADAAGNAEILARAGVDAIIFNGDHHGNQLGTDRPAFLKEMIRQIHLALVVAGLRERVNLLFSGGIAMAEHMAKAVICGADAVVVDRPAMIAMECRLCGRCTQGLECPVALDKPFDPVWGAQRIVNLMGAWHSQLLEVMGAMGIREARRLRGEVGRSMWFEDLEKDSFGPIFGQRRTQAIV
ncbi:MAG: glutamate synthase-related protein [Pseudomonadota bacterium]